MVVRQGAPLGVGVEQGIAELAVPGSLLELPERDGEVVEVEAPAAVVEVDRSYRTLAEQEVLVVKIAVDETERAGVCASRRVVSQTRSSASATSAAASAEINASTRRRHRSASSLVG